MRGITWLAGVLALSAAGSALAQGKCSCAGGTPLVQRADIATLLGGKTVCAALASTKEVWQEVHSGTTINGGSLSDLKGTATAQEVVGSWSTVIGNGGGARVRYDYGSGGAYEYEVCTEGAAVHFCGATNITGAIVKSGGPC